MSSGCVYGEVSKVRNGMRLFIYLFIYLFCTLSCGWMDVALTKGRTRSRGLPDNSNLCVLLSVGRLETNGCGRLDCTGDRYNKYGDECE